MPSPAASSPSPFHPSPPVLTCLLSLTLALVLVQVDAHAASAADSAPSGSRNTAIEPAPREDKLEAWTAQFQGRLRYAEKMSATAPAQVIFDGDSITDLFRTRGEESWRRLESTYHAIDFGISGDRTEQVIYRLDHGQARGMHPTLIFLMIGHNNVLHNTPEQICDGVAAIISRYQTACPEAVIILQGTFPSKEPGSRWRKAIAAVNALLPRLAQKDKVVFVDFGDRFLSPDGTISTDIMPDGTHPTAKGYAIWSAAIQPILDHYFPASNHASP